MNELDIGLAQEYFSQQ